MPSAAVRRTPVEDMTVYPVSDNMGDPTLQTLISVLLLALIKRWLATQGKPTFVGMNQFFYWKQFDPSECVAPDVYLLPGVSLTPRVGAWKTWETGKLPTFALEVVSQDVDKDYLASPPKYDRLGVKELIVFDPDFASSSRRVQWQVFRRVKNRGLAKVEATNEDRVYSRVLGCFLRAVGTGDEVRLRLGTGAEGDALVPTDEEACAQASAERDEATAERDEARSAQERAEAEVRKLRAELAKLGRARPKT
jgi:Uma2 family endonuclease